MTARLSMLDLFSGSGSASRAATVRGWLTLRVDIAPGSAMDLRADLARWTPPHFPFDLVWASPPCQQLSTANQRTRSIEDGLRLVRAAIATIRAVQPRWWVLENVHGATRAIGRLLGPPTARYGSFYLWGEFPPFQAVVPRDKSRMYGRRSAERRAAIPWQISEGLVRACEALAAELPPRSSPELPPSSLREGSAPEPSSSPPAFDLPTLWAQSVAHARANRRP